jgi:glutathione S-transferase
VQRRRGYAEALGAEQFVDVQKALWLLTELALPYERVDYGGAFGGNKDPDYLRLNPNGLVPTLIDDGTVIWESNTILRYLANKVGPTDFYPTQPARRAFCERWMDWQLSTLNAGITPRYVGIIRTPADQRDRRAIAALERRVRDCFKTLDGGLEETLPRRRSLHAG